MNCLTDLGGGSYSITTPQPETTTSCTVIAVSPTELQTALPELSVLDAQVIGNAIAILWGTAFVIRAISTFLKQNEGASNE